MSAKIHFHSEEIDFSLSSESVYTQWIEQIIHFHHKNVGELNYIFCNDEYLLKVNQEYLQHDYYTDIITFDYCDHDMITGDLFISIDRVKENAKSNDQTFHNELLRVMSHGILHLLGFKDKTDKDEQEMRTQETMCINQFQN